MHVVVCVRVWMADSTRMPSTRMSHLQEAILLAMGLQHRYACIRVVSACVQSCFCFMPRREAIFGAETRPHTSLQLLSIADKDFDSSERAESDKHSTPLAEVFRR